MAVSVTPYSLKVDGNKILSKNFKVKEFACKDGSDPIFIAPELVTILQKVRDHFGKAVTINSAYRTPTHNKSVGGVAQSQHTYGTAADIKIAGIAPQKIYDYVDSLMPNKGGVGLYEAFVHVDVREKKSRF